MNAPRLVARLGALVLAVGMLTACRADNPLPIGPDPAQVRSEQQHILNERSQGILTHDRALFMKSVATTDPAFVRRQRRFFDNVAQLPIAKYAYKVLDAQWPEPLADPDWGSDPKVPRVEQTTELVGYDDAPIVSTTGFGFATIDGRMMLVSERTRGGSVFPGSSPTPWDLTRIHVHTDGGVLGIFDDATESRASLIMDVVAKGVGQVSAGLPFAWNGRVVAYGFENKTVLDSFDGVPGGNIRHLGAMTFPVYTTGGKPAGMRFTVLPSSLAAGQPFLGRIVRHELSHVAIGTRDDGAPTWVAEGIAEYLGARDLPANQRRIASVALANARRDVTSMPASRGFNGSDQDWHYALAWMACDYIARTQGEARMWAMMTALHDNGKGTSDDAQDAVLMRVLGIDSHTLAQRAAARIRKIYG